MTRTYLGYAWRARWRSLLVLGIMVGLAGGAVFAAVAGARRSSSALDRFHEAGQTHDVFLAADLATAEPEALREVLDGPLVESTNDMAFVLVDDQQVGFVFAPTSRRGLEIERGVVLEGRRADPEAVDEVTLSERTARKFDLAVGDTMAIGTVTPAQAEALFTDGVVPTSLDGPELRVRVVGIIRSGFDLGGGSTPLTLITPALWEEIEGRVGIGSSSHLVRLVDRPGAFEEFTDAVEAAYGEEHLPSINAGQVEQELADSISVITVGLLMVAGVVAVAGAAWIVSAVARTERLATHEVEVLRALGSTTGERRLLLAGTVVPGLLLGLVVAPVVAVALSPLLPVGTARRVDPDAGLHVDAATLLLGSVALLALLVLAAVLVALRLARAHPVPAQADLSVPAIVDGTARRLRPAPATGVRFALHAPAGSSTPVRPALAGALVAVLGVVAVAVVGASLQRLVDTPRRWGTTWDVAVDAAVFAPGEPGGEEPPEPDHGALLDDAEVGAAAEVLYDEQVTIEGVEAISMTLEPVKGEITPTVIRGREPRADDEIAVGRDTFDAVGAGLGDTVSVESRHQRSGGFRVVGVIAFPTIGESTPLATGASFTEGGGDRLLLGDPSGGDDVGHRYVAVRWAAGVDGAEALEVRGIEATTGGFEEMAYLPTKPPDVEGLRDVRGFPMAAAAALAVLGLIATGHALIVTVRRRRLELGVLSSLGFTPGQRRSVIFGQATTIAVVALVVGLPLGAVVGRLGWSAIARSLGVEEGTSFPLLAMAGGVVVVVVALNVVAAVPAFTARRLQVAEALRSE
jgi:ABC-type lipoprotein release transport system permease subunit